MEVGAVCRMSLLVLLFDNYSVQFVESIRVCQSDCNRIITNNDTSFSSFHVHCTKLFGLKNTSRFASIQRNRQKATVKDLLETCSANGRLLVSKRENDICVETRGLGMIKNISKLLIFSSKSYEIDLKTHVVRTFHFPWKRMTCVAYMRTVKRFVIGFKNKLVFSSVNYRNKRTLIRDIYVADIAVDEEENIIFLKILTKQRAFSLHTMAQNGTNFKSLPIASIWPVKFDIDRIHKLVYVYKERKLTRHTYEGTQTKDVAQNILSMNAMIFYPTQGVLYFLQDQQLKMITKAGKASVVAIIKQFKVARFMEIDDNYLYIIARGVDDKVFVVHIADSLEFKIIKVSKCRFYYRLCLF